MPNAIRSRGGTGNRAPGLVDPSAVQAGAFFFANQFSVDSDDNSNGAVIGPQMDTALTNAGMGTWGNQITVAIWHKFVANGQQSVPDSFDGVCNASNTWSSLSDGWGMYWNNSTTMAFFAGTFSNAIASPAVTASDWNFFVGVYDGTEASGQRIKSYANGNNFNQGGTLTSNLTGLTNNIEVGKTGNTMNGGGVSDFTPGRYDEFAIWKGALSADEIDVLYNSGVAGIRYDQDTGLYTSSSDLVVWWQLGDDDTIDVADGFLDSSGNSNTGTSSDITIVQDVAGGGV